MPIVHSYNLPMVPPGKDINKKIESLREKIRHHEY